MFTSGNRQQKRPRWPSRQLLTLEVLEDRTLLSTSPTTSFDPNGLAGSANPYSSTDILVQFQGTPGTKGGPTVVAGTTLGTQLTLESGYYVVNLNSGMTVAKALAGYTAEKGVLTATPDYEVSVSSVPNDPDFSQQWSLNNTGQNGGTPGADIHAEQAWSVTTGNRNIIVAVVDSGVAYDDTDLAENIWINQADIPDSWYTKSSASSGYDKKVYKWEIQTATPGVITMADLNNPVNAGLVWKSDGNSLVDGGDLLRPRNEGGWTQSGKGDDLIGENFASRTINNPQDDNGHGTHVAGIIGASGNNGVGVAGIDWKVQIMPVKVLNRGGSGTWSMVVEGINYAVEHGANIINLSLGGSGAATVGTPLYDALLAAQEHGVICVAAAGNNNANIDNSPAQPASYSTILSNVVTVAATTNTNQLASFSNNGVKSVDLAAPGKDILSTWLGNGYNSISGTSMAAPEVSGALALIWGLHPDWSYSQVINAVLNTTQKVPSLEGKVKTGGILDLAAAVRYDQVTVGDSSFESPALAAGSYQFNPKGSAWTFSGSSGIETNGSGWGAADAPYGTQAAILMNTSTGGETSQISQILGLSPGIYSISFWAARLQGYAANPIQVLVDGQNVGSPIRPDSTSWALYQTVSFTITSAGPHTIAFVSHSPPQMHTGDLLDEVTITDNPISDSSFESPILPAGSYQVNPTGSPWTFYGNSGIESNGSSLGAANAPYGKQAAFLVSYSTGRISTTAGAISQTVTLNPGTYSISFWAAQRGIVAVNPIQVQIDGQNVGSPISPTSTWAPYQTVPFTITSAGLHTIAFVSAAPNNGYYISFIDEASLVDAPPAPQVNLSSSSNTVGIVQDGSTSSGGLANDGNSLSASGLGGSVFSNNPTFALGDAGSNNVVPASGQTLALPQGNYSTLWFLAGSQNSNQFNLANIPSPLSVTDKSEYGDALQAHGGLDWFWATYAGGSLNAKPQDLRN